MRTADGQRDSTESLKGGYFTAKQAARLCYSASKRNYHVGAGNSLDLQRLRRQAAFGRFLARLLQHAQTDWVLKGGYAVELRFHTARATKDLDFTVRAKPAAVLEYYPCVRCELEPIPRFRNRPSPFL